ncbi:response regulator [Texcoconibacillus texcoconensis]|uniref:CitB family two-component system response regulator MalR n=1 Tax=Texcoconibacillus texcoconensis TaxID=1095777 RepID=A0A840QM42_9BACI|nr:response regulator [Texcoconibacillus texcoconensis]MBB5172416.1 CitB family two-component system response regulator MalR [Texcoconibacillus texcoconensis]
MINVLIVEDDPMVAELNSQYLEKVEGYHLTSVAHEVSSALQILKEENIDLILLDIYLPNKNGWEVLSSIRSAEREVDIIIISAASDNESIKKALRFGVVDYLIKPFEFERFNSALENYKQEQLYIYSKQVLKQDDIDSNFFQKSESETFNEKLPKGLTKNTLKLVWGYMEEMEGVHFSSEELANEIGLSRVSIRKYLKFLADLEVIEENVIYGTIGRPVSKYKIVNRDKKSLRKYLNVAQ